MWGHKKEKVLENSIFSFSHIVFYTFGFTYFFDLLTAETLNSSKLKELTDDNFKFDENNRKFSKWFENTVGKGEIARDEQFLLFPQFFQMTCTADT